MTENLITVKELAIEIKTSSKNLRKWLRSNGIEKPGTRWEWPENHTDLTKILDHWNGKEPIAPKVKESAATVQESIETAKPEPKEEVIYHNVKSNWKIIRNPEGAVKATYTGPTTTDSTPWITEEEQIRKTLPNYIKREIMEALQ